eukprot:4744117-Amphidinium_carterae.1
MPSFPAMSSGVLVQCINGVMQVLLHEGVIWPVADHAQLHLLHHGESCFCCCCAADSSQDSLVARRSCKVLKRCELSSCAMQRLQHLVASQDVISCEDVGCLQLKLDERRCKFELVHLNIAPNERFLICIGHSSPTFPIPNPFIITSLRFNLCLVTVFRKQQSATQSHSNRLISQK